LRAHTAYLAAFRSALQAKLEYRADFVVGMVTSVLLQLAALSFLLVVFQNAPSLAGWRGPEVVFLFGMTAICLGCSELFFNHIWMLPQYIVSGDLDRLLMYPVHSLLFFLVTRPELHAFGNLLTGASLVVGSLLALHAPWYFWLLVPLWCACGSLIYTSLLVVFGSLSFKLLGPYSHYLMVPHNLLQATRYPLAIYPGWLFYLLLIAMPFGSIHFLPASFLFGKAPGAWRLFAPPLAAAVCMAQAQWFWNWGLRRYESTGS
jgi:ABC-2 type transport system permease protein